jgi:hypothetical protein
LKNGSTYRRFNCRRTTSLPFASTHEFGKPTWLNPNLLS